MKETETKQIQQSGASKKACGSMFSGADLRKLILPLIVEQILAVTVGMADTVMVSSVGEAATSGVSLVDMISTLLINLFAAISTGGAVVASQYIGQKREDRACAAADQLLLVTGVISLLIMGLLLLVRRGLLSLLYGSIAPDVMNYALSYLVITAFSYPFLAIYNSCAALFRSMGNSKISMKSAFVMNVINVFGDAFLVFVMHWDVVGAAIATLVSRIVCCMILVYRLHDQALPIHISLAGGGWRIQPKMIRSILHIGIPGGVENSIFQLGRVLVVSVIASFGTIQIAANAVANNFDSMGILPGQAMNLAMITVVGQCVGAMNFDEAEYYAKKLMRLTYLINAVCCIAVIISLPVTLRIYGLADETLRLATILIIIHNGLGVILWPASFTLSNVLRASNDVTFPMVVSIISMIVMRIACGSWLAYSFGLGAIGIWIAMVLDWVVRAGFFYARYRSGKWKTFYRAEKA